MIRKILCYIDIKHEWYYLFGNFRKCWHCGKDQHVSRDDK